MTQFSQDPFDQMVENSYKNFHAKGVSYLCLSRTPALTKKLYIFEGDVSKFPEVVNPHDHRYNFRTQVLSGAIDNRNYSEHLLHFGSQGEWYNEFEWMTPLNGGSGFKWVGERHLFTNSEQRLLKGQSYSLPFNSIHTINVRQDQTVLTLEQFADEVALDKPTSTFTLNREPPSLDGLYERFTVDEIRALLAKVKPLFGR